MSKLRFRVVFCSGEDPEYPADELNVHSPHTKGWQSPRFCEYPQELGFALDKECRVQQIQILSHQSKIATRVELFVGTGVEYTTAAFVRLGYLSLDSNQRSNFHARELKSVYIDAKGSFLKLLTHRCHVNKYNLFNQVAIVAVNLLGEEELDAPDEAESGLALGLALQSPTQGPVHLLAASAKPSRTLNDLSVDMNFDPLTAGKLRQLFEAKQRAVRNEDYTLAKQIKLAESELRELGGRLAQLDLAKAEAVEVEDYDRAKLLKDEINALRMEIEGTIRAINMQNLEPSSYECSPCPVPADSQLLTQSPREKQSERGIVLIDENSRAHKDPETRRPANLQPRTPRHEAQLQPDSHNEDSEMVLAGCQTGSSAELDDRDRFPPGRHPLEGVPNLEELPTPEPLTATHIKDSAEITRLFQLVGEYLTRCHLSKVWALREAFFAKMRLLLPDLCASNGGLIAALPALVEALKGGVEDKISQVFLSSHALLQDVCNALREAGASRSQTQHLEPIVVRLVGKLGDGQARIRDGAHAALLSIARSSPLGPVPVCANVVRPLPTKQKTAWRPLLSRLQILCALVQAFGIGASSGLSVDTVMEFLKTSNAFAHSNGEVRDAARDVCVALHICVGRGELSRYLSILRPKQREEYEQAFSAAGPEHVLHPPASTQTQAHVGARRRAQDGPSNDRIEEIDARAQKSGSPRESEYNRDLRDKAVKAEEDVAGEGFTQCMFCHARNQKWDEDALDLHYWRECAMLMSCPACTQIVETSDISQHLVGECESSTLYAIDDVTGLAVSRSEIVNWKNGPHCRPVPDGHALCPLCFEEVPASEDGWKMHLSYECLRNPRLAVQA